jgi:hypothetical protein
MRDGARRDTDALSASAGLTVLGKNGSRAASSDKRTMRLSIVCMSCPDREIGAEQTVRSCPIRR